MGNSAPVRVLGRDGEGGGEQALRDAREQLPRQVACAAAAIHGADAVLLCLGGGLEAGSLPRQQALVGAVALADEDPAAFYGGWGRCFNIHRQTPPHGALALLASWAEAYRTGASGAGGSKTWRVYTTNIDGHATSMGLPLLQSCGSTRFWCCGAGCGRGTDGPAERWSAPPWYRFSVEQQQQHQHAGHQEDEDADGSSGSGGAGTTTATSGGGCWRAPATSEVEGRPLVHWVRMSSEHAMDSALDSAAGFASNHPRCPGCGGGARPDVQMGVDDFIFRPHEADTAAHEAWKAALLEHDGGGATLANSSAGNRSSRVVVLEIGCGGAGSVAECRALGHAARVESESLVAALNSQHQHQHRTAKGPPPPPPPPPQRATLVRLHATCPLVDDQENPALQGGAVLPLLATPDELSVLQSIDAELQRLRSSSE
jgi:hypothetical protein